MLFRIHEGSAAVCVVVVVVCVVDIDSAHLAGPPHILLAGMVTTANRAMATPMVMSMVLYELAVLEIELNHDAGPEPVPVAKALPSLTKDALDMVTFFSTRLS